MCRRLLVFASFLTLALFLNTGIAKAQFQSLPQTDNVTRTGKKIPTAKEFTMQRNSKRYLCDNKRKNKFKTRNRYVVGVGVSRFNLYISSKANRREKLLARKR